MMALAEKETVIRLIGSPSPREQEAMDIDDTLEEADGVVYEITRKDNWAPNEYGFRLAVQAANKYAAAELLNEFYDPRNKAPQYQKDFEDTIEKLRRTGYGGDKDSGNPMFQIAIGSYKENVEKMGPFITKGFFGANFMDWSEYYQDEYQ
jgi:hypothetical protein